MLLVGATSTAVNLVCTIIHPSKGCSEDSVWKSIGKAQMESHGTNPCAFILFFFAKATTGESPQVGGWVLLSFTGIAFPHLSCRDTAPIKHNHSIIKAGKDSQSISQCPWRNEARLAWQKRSSDFNFRVHGKGKK